jgi:hypothetical protein
MTLLADSLAECCSCMPAPSTASRHAHASRPQTHDPHRLPLLCPQSTDKCGMTLLHSAVITGQWPLVSVVLRWAMSQRYPLRLDAPGPHSLTPLHLLAVAPGGEQVLRGLLHCSAAAPLLWFTCQAEDGCSPAQHAQMAGRDLLNRLATVALQVRHPQAATMLLSRPEQQPEEQEEHGASSSQGVPSVASEPAACVQQQQQQQHSGLTAVAAVAPAPDVASCKAMRSSAAAAAAEAAEVVAALAMAEAAGLDEEELDAAVAAAVAAASEERNAVAAQPHGPMQRALRIVLWVLCATLLTALLAAVIAARHLQLPGSYLLDSICGVAVALLAAVLSGCGRSVEQLGGTVEMAEDKAFWGQPGSMMALGQGQGLGLVGGPWEVLFPACRNWELRLHHSLRRLTACGADQRCQARAARDMQMLGMIALAALATGLSSCALLLAGTQLEPAEYVGRASVAAAGGLDSSFLQLFCWRLSWTSVAAVVLLKWRPRQYAASRAAVLPCVLLMLLLVACGAAASMQQVVVLAVLMCLHLMQERRPLGWLHRLMVWDLATAAVSALAAGQAVLLLVSSKLALMGGTHVLLTCLAPVHKWAKEA